jgi:hypothetical protein
MSIAMDPGGTAKTGQSMHDLANSARYRTKPLLNSSDAAAQANPGWTAGAALGACRTAWQDQLGRLLDQTVAIGDNLMASAATTSATDQAAEDRLDRVAGDMAGQ